MIQRPHKFLQPVNLDIRLDMPDRRIRDVTNYVKAAEDLLVRHAIIRGDDTRYVRNVSVGLPEIDETIPVIMLRMA